MPSLFLYSHAVSFTAATAQWSVFSSPHVVSSCSSVHDNDASEASAQHAGKIERPVPNDALSFLTQRGCPFGEEEGRRGAV